MTCPLCDAGNKPKLVAYIPIVEAVQVRFPRSKKRRIRKKWAKQARNLSYVPKTWTVGGAELLIKIFGEPHKFEVGSKLENGRSQSESQAGP